ncbi:uncharacterized protein [Triticum aestivum]|uniref:uncharacterized protein isoform X2 n=1 Tax=Triticum aestivum TaxID=4565 RepID=UPI001D0339D7|nr:uncharacterized protein LOC123151400 isoform X2 [Triticum aestivum]
MPPPPTAAPPATSPSNRGADFLHPLVGGPLFPAARTVDNSASEDQPLDHPDSDLPVVSEEISAASPSVGVTNSFSSLVLLDDNLNSYSSPATLQRARGAEKRATDAAKVRRSRHLAEKEGEAFMDMTTKAMRAKARKFDLQLASADLVAALEESGLTNTPEEPVLDTAVLAAIASACGAETEEAAEVSFLA